VRMLPKEGVLTIGGGNRQPCDFEPVFKDLEERQRMGKRYARALMALQCQSAHQRR
jgi:hypothetical protein